FKSGRGLSSHLRSGASERYRAHRRSARRLQRCGQTRRTPRSLSRRTAVLSRPTNTHSLSPSAARSDAFSVPSSPTPLPSCSTAHNLCPLSSVLCPLSSVLWICFLPQRDLGLCSVDSFLDVAALGGVVTAEGDPFGEMCRVTASPDVESVVGYRS